MKIKFFEGKDGLMDEDAVKPGVFIVKIAKASDPNDFLPLYIGESYSMAQRCGRHLYETLEVDPQYFGLTREILENPELMLLFEVLDCVKKSKNLKSKLKTIEKARIKKIEPISQYNTCDRVLPNRTDFVDKKIKAFLSAK